ncbi:mediator of RNA polymerase II transcription subunit 30 isoform X1 [Silurus meridionalis]|uniref:mediator of RNA polymerase II transcription subunit 30 isoform X1 n=1 Tax=Silurus meridionalis TaxID=175797 RepID=UPI001EEB9019|nr:mediator of RNA polymerase II transcription subunit 30 isoform X1 [Silurus meridionalis]XP_046690366.1 mediator of RNA polymerase II transcription subunit 30 isoform X1 [Silurus meridionalis]XP_046690367.1 mediator of RNA polymerase II transcription subunit 30 isoform X1 [Silurus meridionalis]
MTTPPLGQFPAQQAQAARDVNTASLCRIGQETVQDIVLRTMEIFQLLRNMQLPNGVTYHPNTHQDRLGKLQEHLRMLSVLFRKLRLVYDKCNENCAGLEPIPPEQLIPYVEDDSSKLDERVASQMRSASEERREVLEVNKKLKQKNQQLKQIMDQLRNLIWEINSMLAETTRALQRWWEPLQWHRKQVKAPSVPERTPKERNNSA